MHSVPHQKTVFQNLFRILKHFVFRRETHSFLLRNELFSAVKHYEYHLSFS